MDKLAPDNTGVCCMDREGIVVWLTEEELSGCRDTSVQFSWYSHGDDDVSLDSEDHDDGGGFCDDDDVCDGVYVCGLCGGDVLVCGGDGGVSYVYHGDDDVCGSRDAWYDDVSCDDDGEVCGDDDDDDVSVYGDDDDEVCGDGGAWALLSFHTDHRAQVCDE